MRTAPGLDFVFVEIDMTAIESGQAMQEREKGVVVELGRTLQVPIQDRLRGTIATLLRRGERQLILDLARVEAIDGAGVGELMAAWTAARAGGGALRITRPPRRVRRLLQVAGVLDVLRENRLGPPQECGAEPRCEATRVPAARPAFSCV
jgi:anti-anti-sigma factor